MHKSILIRFVPYNFILGYLPFCLRWMVWLSWANISHFPWITVKASTRRTNPIEIFIQFDPREMSLRAHVLDIKLRLNELFSYLYRPNACDWKGKSGWATSIWSAANSITRCFMNRSPLIRSCYIWLWRHSLKYLAQCRWHVVQWSVWACEPWM